MFQLLLRTKNVANCTISNCVFTVRVRYSVRECTVATCMSLLRCIEMYQQKLLDIAFSVD